ncbi:Potassium transporter family protein [Klebsormidium nitens]|uniref:Potassium transporter n=1 Tax=Klebsormidium nitens TaxID=105231 RepID=A0A1Y1ISP9_KLENI|nr:Potassium transporter family protein [Klebsormidium nitens]|eukprot:GAQ92301.1 Potassium transporter family protein [Klebsormidium nitens]
MARFRGLFERVTRAQWTADADIKVPETHSTKGAGLLWLAFGTIGVVYGDIGTSPLYVYASIFPEGPPSNTEVIGAMSLIFWTITLLLLVKYALIVLFADDNGNGGTFALYSLLRRQAERGVMGPALPSELELSHYGSGSFAKAKAQSMQRGWRQRVVTNETLQKIVRVLVVIGVGAILGDGVLTPAISVVSACEGIQIADPSFTRGAIVGLAMAILAGLFLIQQFGTALMSKVFSPVVMLWLLGNAVIGVVNIAKYDASVFKAISPHYFMRYFIDDGKTAWKSLGGVLLCATGVEALFADLGHFNRQSVQLSCFALLYPCIILTYFGQTAYLLKHPENVGSTYYKSLPHGTFWPMFILATLAAIVASQALISASFQIVYQAIAQGFFPRFHVVHTSRKILGQVYIPLVNYMLMTLTLVVVGIFQKSAKLGQAYGLAVITDMVLTTHFMTLVILTVWRRPLYEGLVFYFFFLLVEGSFLSSTIEKIPKGGWFSIMMALIYAAIMLWWYWGSSHKRAFFHTKLMPKLDRFFRVKVAEDSKDEQLFIAKSDTRVLRSPGLGLYYSDSIFGTPPVLVQHLKSFPIIHEVVIFMTNRFVPVPEVLPAERFLIEQLGVGGFYHCIARYGYMDRVQQGTDFAETVLQHILILLTDSLKEAVSDNGAYRMRSPTDTWGSLDFSHHGNQNSLRSIRETAPVTHPPPPPADVSIMIPPEVERRKATPSSTPSSSAYGDLEMQQLDAVANGSQINDEQDFTSENENTVGSAKDLSLPANPEVRWGAADFSLGRVAGEALRKLDEATKEWLDEVVDKLADAERVPSRHKRAAVLAKEIRLVRKARDSQHVVYMLGRATPQIAEKPTNIFKRLFLEIPYLILVNNFHSDAAKTYNIPQDKLYEVGMQYKI